MPKLRESAPKDRLTIEQLVSQSGVSERTLRRWTRAGVFPGPLGGGRASYYQPSHVLRARAIQTLRLERLSMREIRDRLAMASVHELERWAALPSTTQASPAVPLLSAPGYPKSVWEMVELSDSLVLMVKADRQGAKLVADEIYRRYRV